MRIRIHFIRIPDPAFKAEYRSGSNTYGYRALMTKNLIKITGTAGKKINFFLSETTIYQSLGLHKERLSYRRSLQLSKEAIQHFKT